MHIVVVGGTGLVGRALCRSLAAQDHRVAVVTRGARVAGDASGIRMVQWDARHPGPWERALDGADAIINLSGAPIAGGRWTATRKRVILASRVQATTLLVDACARLSRPPRVLINASGIGFYGARSDEPVDEATSPGTGFVAELCIQWEHSAVEAQQMGMRVVFLRTGMVLAREGGALPRMAWPFRLFVGGTVPPGHQWVSWIHRDDVVGLIERALHESAVIGPMNLVAPNPVRMTEFCKTLGRVLHRPCWLPVPETALRAAMGEMASMLTTGQRVRPVVAERLGYRYRYAELEDALRAVYHGAPARNRRAV